MKSFEEKVFSALKCAGSRNVQIRGNCGENDVYCGGNKIRVRFEGDPLLPDGLTVGGSLDLSGCTGLTALPYGLTVGQGLDLTGCTGLTSIPNNIKIGGGVFSDNDAFLNPKYDISFSLKNGDYVPGRYIFADRILTHVAREKKIGEYTYYIGKIKGKNVVFDGKNYAHCKTFSDGVLDLSFKAAQDRGAEQYSALDLDSVVSKDEAVTMYRVITGACKAGTEHFIGNLPEVKPEYKISEIIGMTRNAYGGETFKNFFERNK